MVKSGCVAQRHDEQLPDEQAVRTSEDTKGLQRSHLQHPLPGSRTPGRCLLESCCTLEVHQRQAESRDLDLCADQPPCSACPGVLHLRIDAPLAGLQMMFAGGVFGGCSGPLVLHLPIGPPVGLQMMFGGGSGPLVLHLPIDPPAGLQMMFGGGSSVAVQDPSYPVYVDSSVIMGMTEGYQSSGYGSIHYMVCRPETSFFPDLDSVRLALLTMQDHGQQAQAQPELLCWHSCTAMPGYA